ncbi:hypothetical protein DYB37_005507 [Aphanomyces astaci]|uniref:Uncharacterized protein n=1 Tax=Aphanomyces astaci TaxID=112090 RepID=A0A418EWL5_APHAT|nr:hypothetical protein DYB37_005507 [Aphanomyces astaci]
MVDLVVAPDDSSSPVDGVESSRSNDDLIAFLCAEYTGLHVPNEAPSNENDVNAAVSADRQAMWNVMETESSKLMLRILGTLTSSACIKEHSENVLTFIPVLIAQLQRLSPTHARETNAAALSGDDVVQDETFGYRSAGVRVLGNMAHRNPAVQDALRACGGLEVLLNREKTRARMTSGKRKRSAILHRLTVDTTMPNSIRPQHHAGAVSDEAPFLASTFRGDGGGLMDVGPFRVGTDGIDFLEFGMVLSLMANDRSGVMASEGFTACDVRLERTLSPALFDDQKQHDGQLVGCHFKDCLFEVLPKMNYDATLAFEKAQLTKKDGISGFSNPLSEMRFKSESEKRLNATAYSHSHGKHVNYGQICLTSGSSASHFVLLPRFKLRRKGEPVQIQDQIMLATDDTRLFVQTSLNRFDQTALSFLTASVAHTSMIQWRLLPYDSSDAVQSTAETYRQKAGHGGFHAGQCLRLCHLETGSWLAYDSTSCSLRLDGCGATDHNSSAMGVVSRHSYCYF